MGKMLLLGSAASFVAHRVAKRQRRGLASAIVSTTLVPSLAAAGGMMLGAASSGIVTQLKKGAETRPITSRLAKLKNLRK
ncbi:hypothetical protein [Zymomonas mobilis]|uniref:hypothetical protein n=1 Tax=Zymomonas mobilis TaxID=542 RepID=UPI0003C73CCF|nr:hypothetical protein [Zymomonas mobilis]AHB09402.1 hypothetical protein ZCP4_0064 [Zymomonas mobilis subsp. mobilis str. CP4 = NRRL B-14023]AHJ69708.1 hypothetical protein A254_00064 [Zymomonas mobilis subsp. mobilis NRRL B-12526]AHJ71564.1 hypothetical protein A265_00064 [Zymomonas mobilis subsp. mobilis str. CP4 = NRRL B-14023]